MPILTNVAERIAAGREVAAFTLPGPVVPYVRVGRERGTARALRYHAYKQQTEADAIALLLEQGVYIHPNDDGRYWYLLCRFYRRHTLGDWDNLYKSIADVLEGVLWENDRQVKVGAMAVEYVAKAQDERTEVQVGLL